MTQTAMIEPIEVSIADDKGKEKIFIIGKFDCVFAREVFSQYPLTALPKVSEYSMNEELMFRALCFAAVKFSDGTPPLRLTTPEMVKNHVTDWKQLTGIERELGKHNFSFFQDGRAFSFIEGLAQIFLTKITETLISLSVPSSNQSAPPSGN